MKRKLIEAWMQRDAAGGDGMDEASPRAMARIAGVLYLIIIVGALFGRFFASSALLGADDLATAAKLLAPEPQYRLMGVIGLLILGCDIGVASILYILLRPVSRGLALLAAFFRMTYVAIHGANAINYFAPLVLVSGAPQLSGLTADQRQALALAFIRVHAVGFDIALVFFGLHCLAIGYLLFRSRFFPRILGALLTIQGLALLVSSTANLLAPPAGAVLFRYLLLPTGVGELSLTLWLVVVGVDASKWLDRAAAARTAELARRPEASPTPIP